MWIWYEIYYLNIHFCTQFHKLVNIILAFNDNSKCLRYLVSNYLDQWEVSILITWFILSNQRAINVPQNGAQTNYVTQVPHVGHRWGTKLVPPQDGDKIHRFLGWFEKIWVPPHFLVGLIYRWGKGAKFKNICINVTFSYTICEK